MLSRMSFSAASIITSAQVFREAVQEKQELIHTIESLYLGLVVIGMHGRIIQINTSARAILGVETDSQVIGVPYARVFENEKPLGYIKRSLDPRRSHRSDRRGDPATPPGGRRRTHGPHLSGAMRPGSRGTPARHDRDRAALLNDITEIRNVERMKTAFISTVSHELRTPLTSIKGFIATPLSDADGFYDADTQDEFFKIIDAECDRLTRLIDDLLNVARIEQGRAMQMNLEPVSISAIAQKVVISQRAYVKE